MFCLFGCSSVLHHYENRHARQNQVYVYLSLNTKRKRNLIAHSCQKVVHILSAKQRKAGGKIKEDPDSRRDTTPNYIATVSVLLGGKVKISNKQTKQCNIRNPEQFL